MPDHFFFAWVNSDETTFDPDVHARDDQDIFDLKISQAEGEFAVAAVEVRTPTGGLLNPSRKRYAWVSCRHEGQVVPLLFGRLTGFPTTFGNVTVELELIAQFPGWETARAAVFETLKVAPYWDPAFISSEQLADPQHALESRTGLYHFHRTTGEVILSDILEGGEHAEVTPFLDGLSSNITGQPAKSITITATVEWEQRLLERSIKPGGAINIAFADGRLNSFTPDTIEENWPKAGEGIGGDSGYTVSYSRLDRLNNLSSGRDTTSSPFFARVPDSQRKIILAATGKDQPRVPTQIERTWFDVVLNIDAYFTQKRVENLTVRIDSDVQELVFSDADQINLATSFQAEDVVGLNLMSPRSSSWFLQPRGEQSFHYLLALGKAQLAKSARSIEITLECSFADAMMLTCDHSLTVHHPKIPGGVAEGKVISYELHKAGDTGEMLATVTVGVSVGNGNAYTPGAQEDSYVTGDTLTATTQVKTGEATPGGGLSDMIYRLYGEQKSLPTITEARVLWGNIVDSVEIENTPAQQESYLQANQYPVRDNIDGVLNEVPTKITLNLMPLTAGDDVVHDITVEMAHPYAPPQGINLAA